MIGHVINTSRRQSFLHLKLGRLSAEIYAVLGIFVPKTKTYFEDGQVLSHFSDKIITYMYVIQRIKV